MSQCALIELLRGRGSHVDPLACIEDISAEMAARQIGEFPHSIAQLVFHMSYWMDHELRRIRGERPKYPQHASESWPKLPSPADEQEWDQLRNQLASLLSDFAALAQSPCAELDRQVESAHEGDTKVSGTMEAVLWQILVHNSYHIGQVALLRRCLGAWPPRRGSDTW